MRIIRKLLKYLLLLVILLALTSSLWLKVVPQKYLSPFVGKSPIFDKLVCDFSTKVSGESMNPIVVPGTLVGLTRCFEKEDLTEETIVLFNDDSNLRFGIIRHVLPLNPIVYKISDEKAPELLHDIVKEEIIGITHDIDASNSKYQIKQELESFILNSNEYLAELYLAKIPKGAGIETSTVEKTTVFYLKKDKFCSVIVPKKNLTSVDIKIIDVKTQNIISMGENIVLNAGTKPNINCMDFGSKLGRFDLQKGIYHYRFFLNHQILESIQFEVE